MDTLCVWVLALAALAVAGDPQLDVSAPSQPSLEIATTGFGITEVDGELVALGPRYKALFAAGEVEFVPALGRSAPRNASASFALASIARDGASLDLHATAAPRLRDDTTVVFPRGAGVEERWTAQRDGIEVSLLLERLPRGNGDLVLAFDLEHELDSLPGEHAEGIELRLAGHGGVSVAPPVAFDARGKRTRGTLRLEAGRLAFVIPAAFLEQAALPILVDPLVGTILLPDVYDLTYALDADADWDPVNGVWLLAWSRAFSSGDVDVVTQRMTAAGGFLGVPVPVESSPTIASVVPAVAGVATNGRFLLVWQQAEFIPPFGSSFSLQARAVGGADGVHSSSLPLATTLTGRPRAAGEIVAPNDRAIVVWAEAGIVQGRSVRVPATGPPVVMSSTIVGSASLSAGVVHDVDISRNGGTDGRVLVAWTMTEFLGSNNAEPWCRAISRSGALLGQPLQLSSDTRAEQSIGVDGDGSRWVVAWDMQWGPGDRDVFAKRVTWNTANFTTQAGTLAMLQTGFNDETSPRLAWCGTKLFVATAEASGSPATFDLLLTGYDSSTLALCEPEKLVSQVPDFDEVPSAIVSRYASNAPNETQSLLLWNASVKDGDFDVAGQLVETFGPGLPPLVVAVECGAGGKLGLNGPAVLGNSAFALTLQNAPPSATLGVLFIGLPSDFPFSCGLCNVILSGITLTAPIVAGSASAPIALPCKAGLAGLDVVAQWSAVLPVPTSPCSLVPGAGSSDRVRITLSL